MIAVGAGKKAEFYDRLVQGWELIRTAARY
jgi:hypothetical protein